MSKRKRQSRKRARAVEAGQPVLNHATHLDAAGIDIGSTELVAALPPDRDAQPVRTFSAFTSGVHALRDWLLEHGIKTVAIESTGNYWITVYDVLAEAGIDVWLVNARAVKGVPGKKTDVCDAQWLQQLHAAGLLKKSHRPEKEIVPLRYLMRHRADLVAQAGQQVQLMQKVLTEMNLHIHHVFSDVDGVSAQAIITAILAGEREPQKLAALRDQRCRSREADILEALRGDFRPAYLFVLRQLQQRWQQLQASILECDAQIAELLRAVQIEAPGPLPEAPWQQRRTHKNMPVAVPIYDEAWRFFGVDLSVVPGIGGGLLGVLMSEVGTGPQLQAAFRHGGAFASWLALCPENRITGGRVLKAKTRKVSHRLADAFRLAAQSLSRSDGAMGQYCRRMKGRLGKAEGIVAVAHKLARIVYAMITTGQAYDEKEAFKVTPSARHKRLQNLQKQAAALGLQLVAA
jgi:transposase